MTFFWQKINRCSCVQTIIIEHLWLGGWKSGHFFACTNSQLSNVNKLNDYFIPYDFKYRPTTFIDQDDIINDISLQNILRLFEEKYNQIEFYYQISDDLNNRRRLEALTKQQIVEELLQEQDFLPQEENKNDNFDDSDSENSVISDDEKPIESEVSNDEDSGEESDLDSEENIQDSDTYKNFFFWWK